jgi:diguanylate cyclase (GGDEF)-like protein/putative nucleotidyltransferase with HDIG domain
MSGQTKTSQSLSPSARIFLGLVFVLGTAALAYGVVHWTGREPLQTVCYLLVAILASRLKVKLPGITGTMSASFLVILLSVVELGLSESLVIGCVTTLAQSFSRERPRVVQLAFNVCASAIAVVLTDRVYHLAILSGPAGKTLPLLAAACVYFLANTLPVSTIISLTEQKSLRKTWRECYFWAFPYYLLGAGLAGLLNWLHGKISWQTSLLLLPGVYLIYRSYRLYLGKLEAEKEHAEQMAGLHLRTIEVLALAIEAKDQTTHAHLQRVRVYATEIAKELKVSSDELEALQAAALLHDIGKLAVPEHIISKPGRLTPEEFEKMKIHPVVGAELLEKVEFPYPVVPIVRAHHEKWDGSGYPFGLKREEIPIGARILAAVDFLDALASDRQYRRALALDDVMTRLSEESGKSFDPKVVEIILRRYRHLEKLVQKRASTMVQPVLSTDVRVGHGAAPASGFEGSSESVGPAVNESTFLDSIAAAKQEVQVLFELSQELGTSLSLDDTLSVFAAKLRRLVPYDSIVIYIKYDDVLLPEHVSGENMRRFSALRIPMGEGVSGWVAYNKKPILNGNPSVEPGYATDPGKLVSLSSAMAVPLEGLEGVVGVVSLYRSEKDAFSKDHLRVLLAVSSKIALAIENALKYEKAENSATTDYLTGLPNARSMFLQLGREITRAKRTNGTVTVMVCDLDGFKQINDRFGHLEGNRVLQIFARRVRETCREYDYVARMGGDEFVVIVPDLSSDAANSKAAQLRELARESGHEVCGEDLLSLSVGKTVFPQDAEDLDTLLAEADRRMYSEKQQRSGKKNRRTYPRLACCVPVELCQEDDLIPVFGKVSDISAGGCFIETGTLISTATKWNLTFAIDLGSMLLEGIVVRSNPGSGIGIKFNDATLQQRERIKLVLEFVERTSGPGQSAQRYLATLARPLK